MPRLREYVLLNIFQTKEQVINSKEFLMQATVVLAVPTIELLNQSSIVFAHVD